MQTQKLKVVVYEIGDRACLRVSPLRGVKRFGVKGKLSPRFVGVLERMGEVANKIGVTRRTVRSS